MSNIEKIKAEIERRAKFHDDAMKACIGLTNVALTHSAGWKEDTELLAFIDSLPDEDLYAEVGDTEEDYIKRSMAKVNECREMICKDSLQVPETYKENTDSFTEDLEEAAEEYEDWVESYSQADFPTCVSFKQAFIAGAEWMRKKDVEDMYMSDNRHFLKCYEQGKVDMKVEMMKDAVEFECIGKRVKMTVKELINYYIDTECCDVADECGF